MFKRSNKDDFLLEIGCEELPAGLVRPIASSLHDNLCAGIRSAGLSFVSSKLFVGPRRIGLLLKSLDPQQAEQHIEKRGPAVKAAYDQEGKPTKAAEGFATSCNTTVDQLDTLTTEKGEWIIYRNVVPGNKTLELMPKIISEALNKTHLTKPMRWANVDYEFIRPVHWLVAMYGKNIINLSLFGCHASNQTYGHHFMHPAAITIKHPDKYIAQLKQAKVIADFKLRRDMIKHQIFHIAEKISAQPILDEALLEEVTNLVEWPVALLVDFEKNFLAVPQAALVAAMQNHQKCFALTDLAGELLPQFITICNISSKNPNAVIRGNQKVMRARLSDAKFFYETDLKQTLLSRIEQLKTITFEEQLGSLHDRVERITNLSKIIAQQLNVDTAKAERASLLAKADLVTNMVGEFPELQGVMGYYYAKAQQEDIDVALAIRDHYKPKSATDTVSQEPLAYIVGIADKIDLLVGIFGIGNKPTGDKDPFGLRRATLGIIRTIVENNLALDFAHLVNQSIACYQAKLTNNNVVADVLHFFFERLRVWYKDQAVNSHIFNAVYVKQPTQLQDFAARINAVTSFKRLPEARSLSEANKRVINILNKNAEYVSDGQINQDLLKEPAEKQLAAAIIKIKPIAEQHYQQHEYQHTLKCLTSLKQPVDEFFEQVMVISDDLSLRKNRLLLLEQLRNLFNLVADISALQ